MDSSYKYNDEQKPRKNMENRELIFRFGINIVKSVDYLNHHL